MDPRDATLHRIARAQHGLVRRYQLIAAGLSPEQVKRWRRNGRLVSLAPGVYAFGHTALRREGWWLAAVWACGAPAAISHTTAATATGRWRGGDEDVTVHVSTTGHARSRPGVVVHRTRHLSVGDVVIRHGVPCTSTVRTIVDCADVLQYGALRGLVDDLPVFDVDGVAAAVIPTRAGTGRLQRLLASEKTRTRSEFERRFRRYVTRHDLLRPDATNVWIEGLLVDAFWREAGVVVELDGRAHHARRAQMRRDRARDRKLLIAGYRPLRFVWEELDDATAADDLRAVVGTGGDSVASMGRYGPPRRHAPR